MYGEETPGKGTMTETYVQETDNMTIKLIWKSEASENNIDRGESNSLDQRWIIQKNRNVLTLFDV